MKRLLLLATLLLLTLTTTLRADTPVVLRSSATVTGRVIRFKDIADPSSAASGALGEVVLGAAALPGKSVTLSAGEIRLRLRANHFDPNQVKIAGPVTVTTQSGPSIAANALVKAAEDALRRALPYPAEDVTIEAASSPAMPTLSPSAANQPLIVVAGTPTVRSLRTATVPVTVSAGDDAKTIEVALRVTVLTTAVVAARTLSGKTLLGEADLTIARVPMSDNVKAEAPPENFVGKRLRRTILTGKPITPDDVETAPVIAARAEVTVRVVQGPVEIIAQGIAQEEGAPGQRIRVRLNARPGQSFAQSREVRAIVENATTVVIEENE